MAIKTTWTEVNQIIKEEFQRLVEKKKIQARIQQINEELAHMEEEDSSLMGEDEHLEEVEAGSEMKVRSHAWTGEEDGDTKWTPEFEHKGSSLLEEDEEEDEDLEDEASLADEFAELGAAIEAKIMAALGKVGEGEEEGEEVEDEDFEEVEVEDEEEVEEPIEEYSELVGGEDSDKGDDIDATRGVTAADVVKEKDEMKTESLNESVSRNNKKYLNVLSEGLDTRKKSALESEVERMRRLANLGGNND